MDPNMRARRPKHKPHRSPTRRFLLRRLARLPGQDRPKCLVRGCNHPVFKKYLCMNCFYYLTDDDPEHNIYAKAAHARRLGLEDAAANIVAAARILIFNDKSET